MHDSHASDWESELARWQREFYIGMPSLVYLARSSHSLPPRRPLDGECVGQLGLLHKDQRG
jgi:hypothetical protein